MTLTRRRFFPILTLVVALSAPSAGFAHTGATGVVKERMDAMAATGDSMKKIAAMFKRQVPYDADELSRLAAVIGNRGGEELTGLFPEHSLDKPTEALPAIWERWERFESLAGQLTERARPLQAPPRELTPGGMASFMSLARTCNDCHTEFRKAKE